MYQALYRKYRPVDFDSVVGQDVIVKTLKNSIINHNFSHAYMFFGSRGTGKTTLSKIFARSVNCLNPKDGIACGKCDSCKISMSKDCIDIIEIDAASNNGVDEIRELRNNITLVPTELKYKVYIIDEVHMLSIGAFNALLKTLEEPPEHAIFILATTDPQKVPETIVSRCQCFSFKRISKDSICDRLKFVCKEEKIKIDDKVLYEIATLSDGGMRDALGMLDKLTSYTNKKITLSDFYDVNGIISNSQLNNFITSIVNGDIPTILNDINLFDNSGRNLIQIATQLLNYIRNLIVDYYLKSIKLEFSIDTLNDLANVLNEKMNDLKKSSNTRIYFELLIINFIKTNKKYTNVVKNNKSVEKSTSNNIDISQNIIKNQVVDKDINKNIVSESNTYHNNISFNDDINEQMPEPSILNIDEIMRVRINNTFALADKKLLKEEVKLFDLLNDYTFDHDIGYLVCSILDSKIRVVSKDNIIISYEFESNVKKNLLIINKLIEVYNRITNSNKKFAIVSNKEWEALKREYVNNYKNNIKYEIMDEPEVVLEELDKNDIISSSAVELFGDIVEVE